MKLKKIDSSDIPELSDKQLSCMRRVGLRTVGDEPIKLTAIWFRCKVSGRHRSVEHLERSEAI